MGLAAADPSVSGAIERVQELTERLDAVGDAGVRAIAEDLTTAVVQMYGAALARMVALVEETGPPGEAIVAAFADDELVAGLLLVHDLHPTSLAERVAQALDRVRPYMASHGGDVELVSIEDGIVRLVLRGSCTSCRASSATLELAVRQALEELCPDLDGMDVEGLPAEPEPGGLTVLAPGVAGAPPVPRWHDLDGMGTLSEQQLGAADVAGVALVLANVEGTLLAYRDRCAGCGASLASGALVGPTLVCPACARGFVLTRAGRAAAGGDLQLVPVPLLRVGAGVRVALAT